MQLTCMWQSTNLEQVSEENSFTNQAQKKVLSSLPGIPVRRAKPPALAHP